MFYWIDHQSIFINIWNPFCWNVIHLVQLHLSVAMWQILYNTMWVEVTCSLYPCYLTPAIVPDGDIPSNCILEWRWCGSQPHQSWDGHVNICFCCKPLIWRSSSSDSALFLPVIFNSSCYFPDNSQIFYSHDVILFPESESETFTWLWIVYLYLPCQKTGMKDWEE